MTWKRKWGKDHICPILQCRLRPGKNKNGESYVITLPCKHRFYRKALIHWVHNTSNQCPVCRKQILL